MGDFFHTNDNPIPPEPTTPETIPPRIDSDLWAFERALYTASTRHGITAWMWGMCCALLSEVKRRRAEEHRHEDHEWAVQILKAGGLKVWSKELEAAVAAGLASQRLKERHRCSRRILRSSMKYSDYDARNLAYEFSAAVLETEPTIRAKVGSSVP